VRVSAAGPKNGGWREGDEQQALGVRIVATILPHALLDADLKLSSRKLGIA
jgi:hypothetical protein